MKTPPPGELILSGNARTARLINQRDRLGTDLLGAAGIPTQIHYPRRQLPVRRTRGFEVGSLSSQAPRRRNQPTAECGLDLG